MEDYLRALQNAKTPDERMVILSKVPDHRGFIEQRLEWAREGQRLAADKALPSLVASFLCQEANALIDSHLYDQAAQKLSEAREEYRNCLDEDQRKGGASLMALYSGRIALQQGKAQQAASYFRTALVGIRTYGRQDHLCLAEYNLGSALVQLGEIDAGKGYLEACNSRSYTLALWETYIDSFSGLGVLHYEGGDMDGAVRHFSQALIEARRHNDLWRVARCCGNLGTVYQRQGKFHAALDNYHQAVVLADQLNDLAGSASARNNIGNLYHVQGEHAQALGMYEKTLEAKELLGHDRSIVITLLNMASSQVELGKLDQAEHTLERTNDLIQNSGLQDIRSQYQYGFGELCIGREMYNEALASFLESRRIACEGNRMRQYHRAETGLAKALAAAKLSGQDLSWDNLPIGKSPESVFEESANFFEKGDMAWELQEILKIAVNFYRSQDKTDTATEMQQRLLQVTQEIASSDKVEAMARLEAELELRKKESEVSDLKAVVGQLRQFAHSASHDLRDPLNSILNFSKLLEDKLSNGPDKEYIGFISRAADQMSDILRDLLDYTKADSELEHQTEEVDLNEVLQIVHDNLHEAIESNNAVILVEPLPVVTAHRTRLIQLFQNLLSNAIKYRRPDRHPEISIHLLRDAIQGTAFEIRDNGTGISAEDRERVFEPFTRANDSEQGTGIGLAVCRKIVESYGGKIWIKDSPQGGSSFCFTLTPSPLSVI